jgi:hypothetical protein
MNLPEKVKKIMVEYLSILDDTDVRAAEWILVMKFPKQQNFSQVTSSPWQFWIQATRWTVSEPEFVHGILSRVNRVNGRLHDLNGLCAVENKLFQQHYHNGVSQSGSVVVISPQQKKIHKNLVEQHSCFEKFVDRYVLQPGITQVCWKWHNVIEIKGKSSLVGTPLLFFDNADISPDFVAVAKLIPVKQLILVPLSLSVPSSSSTLSTPPSLPYLLRETKSMSGMNCKEWTNRIQQLLQWNDLQDKNFEIVFFQTDEHLVSRHWFQFLTDTTLFITDESSSSSLSSISLPLVNVVTLTPHCRYFRCLP